MITSIIFSKNRPLQLDLCIRSMKQNLPECKNIVVIYKNSEGFADAQQILMDEHPQVNFWEQGGSLFADSLHATISSDEQYVGYFTDDDIVFANNPTNYEILSDPSVACVSLRMGLNICKRSSNTGQSTADLPERYSHLDTHTLVWPKTLQLYGSYWSYSLSVDGHVFRKKDMINMLDEICHISKLYPERWKHTPNELESALQRFWTITPNVMVSPMSSRVVNSPNNRVQNTHENLSGAQHSYDEDFLLGKYMAGNRINLDYLDFSNIQCPHTEIDILKGLV